MQDYHIFDTKEEKGVTVSLRIMELKKRHKIHKINVLSICTSSLYSVTFHSYKLQKNSKSERNDNINVMEREQKWYLKSYVVADLTFFHLILIHGVDVLLQLYDASGGEHVFTLVLNKENKWSVEAVKRNQSVESKFKKFRTIYLLLFIFYYLLALNNNFNFLLATFVKFYIFKMSIGTTWIWTIYHT